MERQASEERDRIADAGLPNAFPRVMRLAARELTGRERFRRVLFPFFAVAAVFVLRQLIGELIPGAAAPFFLYTSAIMAAGWYGGLGPGLFAIGISVVVGLTSATGPNNPSPVDSSVELVRLCLFIAQGLFICGLCEALHRARKREEARGLEAAQASQARLISEVRFRQLVKIGGIGVCTGSLSGEIFEANDVFLDMLEIPRERLESGKLNWKELTPPEYTETDAFACNQIRTLGRCDPFEKEYFHSTGRRVPTLIGATRLEKGLEKSLSPLQAEGDENFIAFIFDRSMHKMTQEQLAAANAAAESARQVKVDFLANTSHELRTPMNAIIGMTELALTEDHLPPRVREYLETSYQAAQDLLLLISDILDFSKLGAGRFTLEVEPFSLRDQINRLMKTLALRASEKGLELACHIPNEIPDALIGDPLRLRQILLNIAGNAVKFTEKGEVIVKVRLEQAFDDAVRLSFAIKDTGAGIPIEAQQAVLEPFTQLDSSTTRQHTGAGLGLAIATKLAEFMEGSIRFDSRPGSGTTVVATVLLRRNPESMTQFTTRPLHVEPFANLRILLVDDNSTNLEILRELVTSWHMRPTTVTSAAAAIRELEAAENEHDRYAIMLVDALMPGIDGFTLVEQVRHDQRIDDPIVLMLSSADHQLFAERCDHIGVSSFLEKPVAQEELYEAILHSLRGPASTREPEREPSVTQAIELTPERSEKGPMLILLAEDTRANQLVVKRTMERRGHEVRIAVNGREAIEFWRSEEFDLILMDVQMPMVDGLQATVAIRSLESASRLRRTPIIAMTAHAMRGDDRVCLDVGMDDYLSKPVNIGELIRKVESYGPRVREGMRDKKRHSSERRIPGTSPSTEQAIPKDPPAPEIPIMNLKIALERLGGDPTLLKDMAQIFVEDVGPLLSDLETALAARDLRKAGRAAHSIKGLASNFDGAGVVELALEIEEKAKQHQDDQQLDGISVLVGPLRNQVDRLATELKQTLGVG